MAVATSMICTPPMPMEFPDDHEEPEEIHLTKAQIDAYNQEHRQSSILRNERAEHVASSSKQDERTPKQQSTTSNSERTLYERAKRHFDKEEWRMKDGSRLNFRPNFKPDHATFQWGTVRLAREECIRCKKINRSKPNGEERIPCLKSDLIGRCLLCFFEKKKGSECRAWEADEIGYANDQYFTNSQYYYDPYYSQYDYNTHGRRANQESFYPTNASRNRYSWEKDDKDRSRRHERGRSPSRRPSVVNTAAERSSSISQDTYNFVDSPTRREHVDPRQIVKAPNTPVRIENDVEMNEDHLVSPNSAVTAQESLNNALPRQPITFDQSSTISSSTIIDPIKAIQNQINELERKNSILIKERVEHLSRIEHLQSQNERLIDQKKHWENALDQLQESRIRAEEEARKQKQKVEELNGILMESNKETIS